MRYSVQRPLSLRLTGALLSFAKPQTRPLPACFSTSSATASSTTTITRNATPTLQNQDHSRPYRVNLTASRNFPVYTRTKAAGQSKFTVIKHVEGDKNAFIQDLIAGTGIPREHITLQPVTGHVQLKGFHVEAMKKWLAEAFHSDRTPPLTTSAAS